MYEETKETMVIILFVLALFMAAFCFHGKMFSEEVSIGLFLFLFIQVFASFLIIGPLEYNDNIWSIFSNVDEKSIFWFLFILCGGFLAYIFTIISYYLACGVDYLRHVKISDITRKGE